MLQTESRIRDIKKLLAEKSEIAHKLEQQVDALSRQARSDAEARAGIESKLHDLRQRISTIEGLAVINAATDDQLAELATMQKESAGLEKQLSRNSDGSTPLASLRAAQQATDADIQRLEVDLQAAVEAHWVELGHAALKQYVQQATELNKTLEELAALSLLSVDNQFLDAMSVCKLPLPTVQGFREQLHHLPLFGAASPIHIGFKQPASVRVDELLASV